LSGGFARVIYNHSSGRFPHRRPHRRSRRLQILTVKQDCSIADELDIRQNLENAILSSVNCQKNDQIFKACRLTHSHCL